MTELVYADDVGFYNPNELQNDFSGEWDTRDNSFLSITCVSEQIKFNENILSKKKNSISFVNSNFKISDNKISKATGKRFSEKVPQNLLQIMENISKGPNVNIKLPKKSFNSKEEREFFKNLIVHKQKTELCKNWILYNDCFFKDSCSFAHGEKDLRITYTPINYKTKICKAFAEKFFCSYGNRCHYSHNIHEKKRFFNYNWILHQFTKELENCIYNIENNDFFNSLQTMQSKRKIN